MNPEGWLAIAGFVSTASIMVWAHYGSSADSYQGPHPNRYPHPLTASIRTPKGSRRRRSLCICTLATADVACSPTPTISIAE